MPSLWCIHTPWAQLESADKTHNHKKHKPQIRNPSEARRPKSMLEHVSEKYNERVRHLCHNLFLLRSRKVWPPPDDTQIPVSLRTNLPGEVRPAKLRIWKLEWIRSLRLWPQTWYIPATDNKYLQGENVFILCLKNIDALHAHVAAHEQSDELHDAHRLAYLSWSCGENLRGSHLPKANGEYI